MNTHAILRTLNNHSKKFVKIDGHLKAIDKRFDRVEDRLDCVENKLDGVQNQINGVQDQINGVQKKIGGVENQLIGLKILMEQLDRRFTDAMVPSQMTTEHEVKIKNLDDRVTDLEVENKVVRKAIKSLKDV